MKAYDLLDGVFGHVERADIRADEMAEGDRRILRAMCLDLLRRKAEEVGTAEWVGVVIAEGQTASGGYEMNMQMAIPVFDSESGR